MSRGEPSAPLNFNRFFFESSGELAALRNVSCPTNSNNAAHRRVGVLTPHHAHDDGRSPALRRAAGRRAASNMSAWSLVGLLISVRVAEDGTCESMPAPTAQPTTPRPTSSAPSMTFAPTPTPPYEYAPTVDAMPYCKLLDLSVCWGNTHRFLKVTANGPFDGIDVWRDSAPALGDLDNDGTLKPRPSIDKLRPHVLRRSQATWTSSWANGMARSPTWRTPGRLRRRRSCKGPEARTLSTASTLALPEAPQRSEISTTTARSDRVRRSINCNYTNLWLAQAT